MSEKLFGSDALDTAIGAHEHQVDTPAIPPVPFVSKEAVSSQRVAAAALGGGILASGQGTYPATPEGAVRAYQDVFAELTREAPSALPV